VLLFTVPLYVMQRMV